MYIKWEKPDLNQQVKHIHLMLSLYMHAHASVNFVNFKFYMQCIFFQRNVTCTVHCNRHILSAVNFHNRHTDDDRCTVEMCLLKFKKLHYFKKLLRS